MGGGSGSNANSASNTVYTQTTTKNPYVQSTTNNFGTTTALVSLNVFLLGYAISTGLAYITGNIVSFYLNKKFTFKNKGKSGKQFIVFFLTMLPAYVISYWLGYKLGHFSENYLSDIYNLLNKITNIPQYRLADNFAVLLSMAIYLFAGFSINKFLVFKKHK